MSGQIVYLAETQYVTAASTDPTGLTPDRPASLDVIVEGVFSTVAKAEAALDRRIDGLAGVRVTSPMRTAAFGLLTEAHGGAVEWTRDVRWDFDRDEPVTAWQRIVARKVDHDY